MSWWAWLLIGIAIGGIGVFVAGYIWVIKNVRIWG